MTTAQTPGVSAGKVEKPVVDSPAEADRVAHCVVLRDRYEGPAERGDIEASFQMAELYDVGCAMSYRPSYAHLGYKYAAERDPRRAADQFRQACEADHKYACRDLARLYESGTGVDRDRERAEALFRRACRLGPETACESG